MTERQQQIAGGIVGGIVAGALLAALYNFPWMPLGDFIARALRIAVKVVLIYREAWQA